MRVTPGQIALAVAGLALILVAATRPWVVRPLDDQGRAIVGPVAFDAEAHVAKAWSESLPERIERAADVTRAGAASAFLKGEGVVTEVDTTSRIGVAFVDLDPQDGRADVALQVGPVVAGSALRDAMGFTFADFDTQIDYANVGRSLNARALAGIPALSDPKALAGRRIAFVGAGAATSQGPVRLVPVRVTLSP